MLNFYVFIWCVHTKKVASGKKHHNLGRNTNNKKSGLNDTAKRKKIRDQNEKKWNKDNGQNQETARSTKKNK